MANSFLGAFFSRMMDLFASSDSGGDKNRLLKNISKKLIKTNIKFYRYSSDEALPQLAKFFFDLYKIVGPTQSSFKNITNPNAFKNMVINYHLTDEQKELESRFGEEAIFESAKKNPINKLTAQIKNDLAVYLDGFNEEKITAIDSTYTKLTLFMAFCTFDYYLFLKKFDASLQEYNFTNTPKFETIKAEYVVDDLTDFTTVAWILPLESDWTDVLKLIKNSRAVKTIPFNTWSKVMQRLDKIRSMAIFEMMIQLIGKKPGYKTVITNRQEHIIDAHLSTLKKTVENVLQKIQSERQTSKVEEELNIIFGTTAVLRLKHYSDTSNQEFETKSLPEYAFCAPLNYLKAFLADYYEKNVCGFADLVLVRGQWASASLATPLSDTHHELLSISQKITEFDNELEETEILGRKIKIYLARADRDREAKSMLQTLIENANEKAYKMLEASTQNLIAVAKITKNLLEDFECKFPEMLINWTELTHFADTPIKEQGIDVYKKIFHFVTLMKFFLTEKEDDQ